MQLAGRLGAAIDVLDDMEKHRRPVAQALKDWGLSHRFAGSADRAAIGTLVYDALRRRASLGWRMACDTPQALAYGALFDMMEQTRDAPSLLAQLGADQFAPPPLDHANLHAWQNRNLHVASDDIQADVPSWCAPFFKNLYGDEGWVVQGQSLAKRPPLDMRLNQLKSSTDKLIKALSEYQAQPIAWFKTSSRIASTRGFERHPNIQATKAFQKGWFEIQDLGSQIVSHLIHAEPGIQLLDYCAGGGGKTLALADRMKNHGQIYAHDSDKARLAPIFARLKRAGIRNVQIIENAQILDRLTAKMDKVLVDAPCSGSGTWRRHPDAKWRLREGQLQRRIEEQRTILDKAHHFVRPGGQLIYVTCSLFDVENDQQMGDFLTKNTEFRAIDMRTRWFDLMPSQAPLPHFGSIGLHLSPANTDSDGFYIAILQHC